MLTSTLILTPLASLSVTRQAQAGRIDQSRADGGMAAGMQTLFASAQKNISPMAPAFTHWHERAHWRRQLRMQPDGAALIALQEPLLPPMPHDMVLELQP